MGVYIFGCLSIRSHISLSAQKLVRFEIIFGMNIGIKQVFSCINICQVLRKLFEQEVIRPSFQTSS